MKLVCPLCGSNTWKQKDRVRSDGVYSMKRRCSNPACSKITTFYPNEERPPKRWSPLRKITEEQVVMILESDAPHAHLAREIGVSAESVRDVRKGVRYTDVRPDLPRMETYTGPRRFCKDCIQYLNSKCSLGFPEASKNTYAQICSVYEEKPRTIDYQMELYSLKPQPPKETDELSAL